MQTNKVRILAMRDSFSFRALGPDGIISMHFGNNPAIKRGDGTAAPMHRLTRSHEQIRLHDRASAVSRSCLTVAIQFPRKQTMAVFDQRVVLRVLKAPKSGMQLFFVAD